MKLRLLDNSIRLRLTQSEVATVRDQGLLRAIVRFPNGGRFEYVLESSPACVVPTAEYIDNVIQLRLPESTVREWADSDQVAIASKQALDGDGDLTLLIEKDFACLTPREGENEVDMYPHPDAGKRNC